MTANLKIVDPERLEWGGRLAHRGSGVAFKDMLFGEDGPDNYLFCLVLMESEYRTPAHRHNFDQVRVMLRGGFSFGNDTQKEGTIGYFAEGTPYEQYGAPPNMHLLLQCSNASRSPYFSRASLHAANTRLQQRGRFESGTYYPFDGGAPHDGFEAVYEELAGQPPSYQKPRYSRPVIMYPDRFSAVAVEGQPGVGHIRLGSFSERDLTLGIYDVEPGATLTIAPRARETLMFVWSGSGASEAGEWHTHFALEVGANAPATLRATTASRLLAIGLPL